MTGAAPAISPVLPQLEGRLEGSAVRVPTPNVSMVELVFMPERPATRDGINTKIETTANGPLKGIPAYVDDPLVSVDFNHDPHSSCFATDQTAVTSDGMVRVVSWYDNEWGFSNRMVDTGRAMGELLGVSERPEMAR